MDRLLIFLLYISILFIIFFDINKKYIPNILNFFLLIFCFFIRGLNNIETFFIGASTYTLPVLLLYGYISDLLKREVIGFGDIKLIIALGGLLYTPQINLLLQIYIFYLITFLTASFFILFMVIYTFFSRTKQNLKNKEIAFSPFICISFVILYNLNLILEFWV